MKVCLWLLGLALLLAGCTGSSSAEPSPVTPDPIEVASPAPEPTEDESTPEPVAVSDDELFAAAVAQLEADVAAGEIPDVIAFDLQSERVLDDVVTLTICSWAGDNVFDAVRDSIYRTTVNPDGTIEASHIDTPLTSGDCLNTELINSAFDFIDEFDSVRAEWSRDPSLFATDDRVAELMFSAAADRLGVTLQGFVDDGVYFEPSFSAGRALDERVADILFRRFRFEDTSVIEILICRNTVVDYGQYRDGVLIDDFKPDGEVGPHSATTYELVRSADGDRWILFGSQSLAWASCDLPDLQQAAIDWLGGETSFEVLPQ